MPIPAINMVEAKRMILACLNANEPLLLLGEPGMGKTSLYEGTTAEEGIGYVCNILSQKDPVDVGGMRIPDEKTGIMRHFVPEDLPVVEDKPKSQWRFPARGILHYDEINVVSMLMQATAYGIINERRVGLKKLMPGWVPMASGNNVTDRSAAQKLSLALANRFNVQRVVPHLDSWLIQYGREHVDKRGTAFLQFRRELFHKMPDQTNPEQRDEVRFPSARSWTKAFKFIDEEPAFRRKIFAGYVGDTAADEFEAFWRIMENATPFDEVVKNPVTARVPQPDDLGTIYAMIGMMSRAVDRKSMDACITYAGRLGASSEYQTAFVLDATAGQDNPLKETAAYSKWAVDNQEYMH